MDTQLSPRPSLVHLPPNLDSLLHFANVTVKKCGKQLSIVERKYKLPLLPVDAALSYRMPRKSRDGTHRPNVITPR